MGKNSKLLITFILGAASGGLLSYVLYKERIEQEAEEEIESMKKYYDNLVDEIEEDHDRELDKLVRVLDEEEREDTNFVDYTEIYSPEDIVCTRGETNDSPEVADDLYSEPLEGEELDDPEYEGDPHNMDFDEEEPYIISSDDYEFSMMHLDKETLSYYDIDDVLTDNLDSVIHNPDYVIGSDALSRFGELSGDEFIVYVRNPYLKSDYEVVKLQDSFEERILGVRGGE